MAEALIQAPTDVQVEPRRPSGRTGLTLLEVVIAAAILSILLLGVTSCITHAMRVDALSRERDAAIRTANRMLDEKVTSVSTTAQFDALLTDPAQTDQGFDVTLESTVTANPILLKEPQGNTVGGVTIPQHTGNAAGRVGRIEIVAIPEGDYDDNDGHNGDHLIQATATVRWAGVDGHDHEIVVTTFKTRPLP